MSADELAQFPATSRFFSRLPTDAQASSTSRFSKTIHVSNSTSSYMPFNHSQTRPRHNYPLNLFNLPNRISLDERSAPTPHHKGADEVPVYNYDHATMSDPISFAEAMKDQGKAFGAVKIIMPENFNNMARTNFQVNPDSFQFKTTRILTNPKENEIMTRLRFYNELIKFHVSSQQTEPSGIQPQNTPVKIENEGTTQTPDATAADQTEPASQEPPKESNPKQSLPKPKIPAFLQKLPMMDKRPLDLFDLFRLVVMRGGYNEVINRKLWAQIGRELGYKGKITSSLSSSLKLSYAKILHPLEDHLGSRCRYIAGLAEAPASTDEEPAHKKAKLDSQPPLLLGSSREYRRSVRAKASKGILLNRPHLIDLKPPLVFSTEKRPGSATQSEPQNKGSKSNTTCSLTPAAQINSYLKYLSSNSANLQDASRHEPNGRSSSIYTLRQFIEKDCKFQEVLIASDPTIFGKNGERRLPPPLQPNGFQVTEESNDISPQALEEVFWQRVCREGVDDVLDGLKIENGFSLSHLSNSSGFLRVGDDFFNYKSQLNASSQPNQSFLSSGSESAPRSQEHISTVSSQSGTPTPVDSPVASARNSFNGNSDNSVVSSSHNEALILNCQPYISRTIGNSLAPFNLHNIPTLPNSLLGAYLAHDINNDDIYNSQLNVGMTFSTENWHCEDHFLQRCSYHFFGRSKRWYFIPESDFEKFESLLREVNLQNTGDKVNLNSTPDCWQISELMKYLSTDDETLNFEYDCLLISLENMISPYPEIRAFINDPEFQKLIDLQKSKREGLLYNQDYFITPEMLKERGIRFSTTLQRPGELLLQYPKTYSASVSLGLNIGEEVNFASKCWLDYALEGEKWLKNQGLLPNISLFKLLVNIANLYENNCGSFDADVYNETSKCYDRLLESELSLRKKARSILKMKEIVIEERSAQDADDIADDDLQNLYPSKIVITNIKEAESFSMSLGNFIDYVEAVQSQAKSEDKNETLTDLISHPSYKIELHLFVSDDRLKSYQKTLRGYSVEFDDWVTNYEDLMSSEEEISLKAYKGLLSEGQKILSALSSAHPRFRRFVSNGMRVEEDAAREHKMSQFKSYVENLDNFVTHCNDIIEECQAVLSLKHQQRIRGASESASPVEQDKQGKLSTLLDLANKVSKFNFYAPEFDQILEFKTEIQNFDRACRNLISKPNVQQSELNDMINLGTSFGIQLPVLDFLIRLRDREVWLKTFDTLFDGGDPFAGKKEVYSLSHLNQLRDDGLRVLSTEDTPKLQQVDAYLRDGHIYDEKIKDYLQAHQNLESVNLSELHNLIVDMEDKAKERGEKRLFVFMESYQKLVDLKAQAPLIEFLQEYPKSSPSLFATKQMIADLKKCNYTFDDSQISQDLELSIKWVENLWNALKKVKTSFGSRPKRASDAQSLKYAVNTELAKRISTIYNKLVTNLSDNDNDPFERSGGYLFINDIDAAYDERRPLRYCLCRELEDGIMIECDRCHEWYHIFCVKEKSEIEENEENYVCPACVLLDSETMSSEFAIEKVSDTVIHEFVSSGENLKIKPTSELGELKKLKALIDNFKSRFDEEALHAEPTSLSVHHAAFYFRKVFGAPVIMTSIYERLLTFLKSNMKLLNVAKKQPTSEVAGKTQSLVGSGEANEKAPGSANIFEVSGDSESQPSLTTHEDLETVSPSTTLQATSAYVPPVVEPRPEREIGVESSNQITTSPSPRVNSSTQQPSATLAGSSIHAETKKDGSGSFSVPLTAQEEPQEGKQSSESQNNDKIVSSMAAAESTPPQSAQTIEVPAEGAKEAVTVGPGLTSKSNTKDELTASNTHGQHEQLIEGVTIEGTIGGAQTEATKQSTQENSAIAHPVDRSPPTESEQNIDGVTKRPDAGAATSVKADSQADNEAAVNIDALANLSEQGSQVNEEKEARIEEQGSLSQSQESIPSSIEIVSKSPMLLKPPILSSQAFETTTPQPSGPSPEAEPLSTKPEAEEEPSLEAFKEATQSPEPTVKAPEPVSTQQAEPGDDTFLAQLKAEFPDASTYPNTTYVDQSLPFPPSLSEQDREKSPFESANVSSNILGEALLAELGSKNVEGSSEQK